VPRKLSPEQQLEIESFYRSASVIATFIDARIPALPSGGFAAAIRKAFDERNLRGLRMAHNDLIAMTEAATLAEKRELDVTLRHQAGITLASLLRRQYQRVERIRARGKVTSEEQYYLVREYIEFAELDPERAAEVPALAAMLQAFEERSLAAAEKRLRRHPPNEK
jgi:hypothetical protein